MGKGKKLEESNLQPQEEFSVPIDKVKMQEDEDLRIVITKTKGGELSILIKSNDQDIKGVSFYEVIGVIETAKNDMLAQQQNGGDKQAEAPQLTSIVLVQEDFDLDGDGRLAKSGLKVGDTIQMPNVIVQIRENAIADMKRKKSGDNYPVADESPLQFQQGAISEKKK